MEELTIGTLIESIQDEAQARLEEKNVSPSELRKQPDEGINAALKLRWLLGQAGEAWAEQDFERGGRLLFEAGRQYVEAFTVTQHRAAAESEYGRYRGRRRDPVVLLMEIEQEKEMRRGRGDGERGAKVAVLKRYAAHGSKEYEALRKRVERASKRREGG